MKKADLLNLVRDELELGTKKGAQDFLDNLDKVIEALAERMEDGDKVKLSKFFTITRKHFDKKEGVCNKKPYVIEEHSELLIKRTSAMKTAIK